MIGISGNHSDVFEPAFIRSEELDGPAGRLRLRRSVYGQIFNPVVNGILAGISAQPEGARPLRSSPVSHQERRTDDHLVPADACDYMGHDLGTLTNLSSGAGRVDVPASGGTLPPSVSAIANGLIVDVRNKNAARVLAGKPFDAGRKPCVGVGVLEAGGSRHGGYC